VGALLVMTCSLLATARLVRGVVCPRQGTTAHETGTGELVA